MINIKEKTSRLAKYTLIAFVCLFTLIGSFFINPTNIEIEAYYQLAPCTNVANSNGRYKECYVEDGLGELIPGSGNNYIVSGYIIQDTRNNSIVGMRDCNITIPSGSAELQEQIAGVTTDTNNKCFQMAPSLKVTGDPWNGTSRLNFQVFQLPTRRPACKDGVVISNYRLRACATTDGTQYYITKEDTGLTSYLGKDLGDALFREGYKLYNDARDGEINVTELEEIIEEEQPGLLENEYFGGNRSVGQIAPNAASGNTAPQLVASTNSSTILTTLKPLFIQKITPNLETNQGADCEPSIIDGSNAGVFSCFTTLNGNKEFYDFDANALPDECVSFKVAVSDFDDIANNYTIDSSNCLSQEEYSALTTSEANQNTTGQSIPDSAANSPNGSNAFEKILGILFNVVAVVLVVIIYFFGSAAMFILSVLSSIFIFLLSINPADPVYLEAAARPWQVLIGLANIVTLSTFMIVGIGYILNLESFKVKVKQFILNIAIFSLMLQLTLQGSALFVNVANGLGDVIIGAYTGVVDGRPNKAGIVTFFTNSINSISVVRCGRWDSTAQVYINDSEDDQCSFELEDRSSPEEVGGNALSGLDTGLGQLITKDLWGDVFEGKVDSRPVQLFIMELVFLLTVLYAIVVMFKGVTYVMFRVVGLWLLMVVSPLALGVYFSPIKSFKKYGQEWMDKFWRLSLAYPVFILGLIIISRLVFGFAGAVRKTLGGSAAASVNTALGSEIAVNAASASYQRAVQLLIAALVIGFVAIGAFLLLLKFMTDVFGAFAKALLGAAKTAVGGFVKAYKGVQSAVGAVGAVSSAAGSFVRTGSNLGGSSLEKIGGRLLKKNPNSVTGAVLKQLGKGTKKAGGFVDNLSSLPDILASTMELPSEIKKGIAENRKARKDGTKRLVKDGAEMLIRTTGGGGLLGSNMSSFPSASFLKPGQSREELANNMRQNSLKDASAAIPNVPLSQSEKEKIASRFKDMDMKDPRQRDFLNQALKDPVTAQKLLNDKAFQEYIKNNLNSLPEDLLKDLRKENPAGFLFNNPGDVTDYINSMSLEEAKNVNANSLNSLDSKAYEQFVKKFPELAGKGGFKTGSETRAGIRMEDDFKKELRNQNFGSNEIDANVRVSRAEAITTPNVNSQEELTGILAKTTQGLGDEEALKVAGENLRSLTTEAAYGKELGSQMSTAIGDDKASSEIIRSFLNDNGVEGFEATPLGKSLLSNYEYNQAKEEAEKSGDFSRVEQMIINRARVNQEAIKDQEESSLARLKTDLPVQMKIDRDATLNKTQAERAANLAKDFERGEYVEVIKGSGITVPSVRNVEELQSALNDQNQRANIEALAAEFGADGEVFKKVAFKSGLDVKGLSESERIAYGKQMANLVALQAQKKAVDQYTTSEIPQEFSSESIQALQDEYAKANEMAQKYSTSTNPSLKSVGREQAQAAEALQKQILDLNERKSQYEQAAASSSKKSTKIAEQITSQIDDIKKVSNQVRDHFEDTYADGEDLNSEFDELTNSAIKEGMESIQYIASNGDGRFQAAQQLTQNMKSVKEKSDELTARSSTESTTLDPKNMKVNKVTAQPPANNAVRFSRVETSVT